MNDTNPTPSLGLSSKEAPSQAALAAAEEIHLRLDSPGPLYRHEIAPIIDKHIAALLAQLAETNGKALAEARAELKKVSEDSLCADDAWATLKKARDMMVAEGYSHEDHGNVAEMASCVLRDLAEAERQLAQSQAREASLAGALKQAVEMIEQATDGGPSWSRSDWDNEAEVFTKEQRAALARHQAAVEEKTP